MMLNPLYVQLIHEQKVRDLETEIQMKQRCLEGHSCQFPAVPWYTRLAKLFARPRSNQVTCDPCKAC